MHAGRPRRVRAGNRRRERAGSQNARRRRIEKFHLPVRRDSQGEDRRGDG